MGTDYSEKERTFIAGLAEDSGRALDDWMTAVTEAKLSNRNDIIDNHQRSGHSIQLFC